MSDRQSAAVHDTAALASTATWLPIAWNELGVREQGPSGNNQRIVGYSRTIGQTSVTTDQVPWCASFLGACLEHAGIRSTRSLRARSYLDWGRVVDDPRFGAIAVFSRTSNPALGHVGFVIAALDSELVILGGNQSNAVTVARFPRSRLISLRWPQNADAQPQEPIQPSQPSALFEHCLQQILISEGGYSEDPHDPGGPTNRGITIASLASYRGIALIDENRPRLIADLKKLTVDDVRPIYFTRYWLPSQAEHFAPPVALMHFDASVNHGVRGAARLLQHALGVETDGIIGPITRGAADSLPPLQLVTHYAEARRARYRSLHHFWRFGRGWLARVDRTERNARALFLTPQDPTATDRKESSMTIKPSPSTATDTMPAANSAPKWWGHSLTIWGTIVTALSTVLPYLGPLIGFDISAELIRQLGVAVTQLLHALGGVIGIILTIAGRLRANQPLMRRPIELKL